MIETLSDGRVRIRAYRADDVDGVYEAVRESIRELSVWMPWCDMNYRREDSAEWVATRAYAWDHAVEYSFVVEACDDDTFLGGCGINRIDANYRIGNLGYWVRSSRAGTGVATGAAALALQFAFAELGLERVEILAGTGNAASIRVAEKLRAVREGLMRRRLLIHGVTHDAWLYSVVRSDLPSMERNT